MKRLKILYRKNLKMTMGKIAEQCVYAANGINYTDKNIPVIVLGVSDKKFCEACCNHHKGYVVHDLDSTEVRNGELTCISFYEET